MPQLPGSLLLVVLFCFCGDLQSTFAFVPPKPLLPARNSPLGQFVPCPRQPPPPVPFRHEETGRQAIACELQKRKDTDDNDNKSMSWLDRLQQSPGTLFILPFVAIVGLDLILNIFFLTKRTFEFLALGQIPSTQTW